MSYKDGVLMPLKRLASYQKDLAQRSAISLSQIYLLHAKVTSSNNHVANDLPPTCRQR